MIVILLKLFASHIIGDFLLQSDKLCNAKRVSGVKGLSAQITHAAIQAVLAYVIVADWACWALPLLVFVSHLVIDWCKNSYMHDGLKGFVVDQCLHILVLLGIWYCIFVHHDTLHNLLVPFSNPKLWAMIIAYLAIFKPTSILLNLFLRQWEPENVDEKGLPLGGKWIGYLERLLIVTFVITDNIEAIGFLLAAKSIFRFGELNKPNEVRTTEYVLIGTLSSFTVAIIVGYLVLMV